MSSWSCRWFQIKAVWERSFSLPDPVTAQNLSDLEGSFVSAARQQVKFGPSSVSDFTRWRVSSGPGGRSGVSGPTSDDGFSETQVEILAREYLGSLTEPKGKSDSRESAGTEDHQVRRPFFNQDSF